MGAHEDLKLLLTNHMQSFASPLLELLMDQRQPSAGSTVKPLDLVNRPTETISSNCRSQLLHLSSSALKNELWALRVFDSNGRLRAGTISGSLRNAIGDYDQCLSQAPSLVAGTQNFTGSRYCLAQVDLSRQLGHLSLLGAREGGHVARLGLCVPAKCRPVEVVRLANRLLSSYSQLSVNKIDCSNPVDSIWSDWPALATLLILVLLVGACALATWLDRPWRQRRQTAFVEAFSLRASLKQLTRPWKLSATFAGKQFNPAMLDALRVLSMLWVIVMHTYIFSLQWIFFDNARDVADLYKSLWTQWIGNGTFAVDNFFLISGLLAWLRHASPAGQPWHNFAPAKRKLSKQSASSTNTELTLQEPRQEPARRLRLAQALANLRDRYFRLAPTTLLTIFLGIGWLPRLARGPGSDSAGEMFTDWCKSRWPLNLLMVHNFVGSERMCFGPTWYLAADFQLFAALQLLLMATSSVQGRRLTLICAPVLAQAIVGAQVFLGRLPSIPLVPADSLASINIYYGQVYIRPHYWVASYSLGCLLASFLADGRLAAVWSGKKALAAQLLSLSWMSLLVLSTYPYFTRLCKLTVLQSTLFALLSKPLWSACTCCLLYFTLFAKQPATKVGRLAARLSRLPTSLAALLPALARLTFGAYLLHMPILLVVFSNLRQTFRFSHSLLFHFSLANIFLAYSAALLLYLLVERPISSAINRVCRKCGRVERNSVRHHLQ